MQNLTLLIAEIFESIQGETTSSGLPSTFIRLAGCNNQCAWCDTLYAKKGGTPFSLQELATEVQKRAHPYVCITGGEPLLQNSLYPFLEWLVQEKYKVSLETGGTVSTEKVDPRVKVILDVKCPGSGSTQNHWPNLTRLKPHDEVKFVLLDRTDFDYAVHICQQYHLFEKENEILFSPVHGQLDPKVLVDWILKEKIPVRLNLQLHKYIWPPETRGV